MNLNNKQVALVTGSARRIGAAIVNHLHQANYDVFIHCHHSIHEAEHLALQLNQKRAESAFIIQQDLEAPHAANILIEVILTKTNRLDLLINNASLFTRTPHLVHHEENWQKLFNVNVKIPFLLSLAAYPLLAKQEGSIINITDIHADIPLKDYSVYSQTKAALAMQTKSLARELAPKVRVNAIAPGAIIWPEKTNALDLASQQKIIDSTPLKRHGDPYFIAEAVIALANNAFITGQILNVDGGRSIS